MVERDEKSAALIHPNNTRRVIRALEMLDEGDRYCDQNAELHKQQPYYNAKIWGLTMDRDRLYQRINQRVDQMVAEGLVDEVKTWLTRVLPVTQLLARRLAIRKFLTFSLARPRLTRPSRRLSSAPVATPSANFLGLGTTSASNG